MASDGPPVPALCLEVRPAGGSTIEQAAREACHVAKALRICVRFTFSGHKVTVAPDTQEEWIVQQYRDACARETIEIQPQPKRGG